MDNKITDKEIMNLQVELQRSMYIINNVDMLGFTTEYIRQDLEGFNPNFEMLACQVCECTPVDLRSEKRTRNIVICRNMIFDYLNNFTSLTSEKMGIRYERDHATALHGKKNHRNLLKLRDPKEMKYSNAFKQLLSLENY